MSVNNEGSLHKSTSDEVDEPSDDSKCAFIRRRLLLWRLLLLPFIPIIALILQTTFALNDSLTNRKEVGDVEEQVSRATEIGKMVTMLQMERSEVAFFIFTNGTRLRSNLTHRFALTDAALMGIESIPAIDADPDSLVEERFKEQLYELRKHLNSEESSVQDVAEIYTTANAALLKHLTKEIKETDSSTIWRYLIGFKNLLRSIETMGIASVLGINYFSRGYLNSQLHIKFIAHHTMYKDLLDSTLNLVPSLIPLHPEIREDNIDLHELLTKTELILENKHRKRSMEDAIDYFDRTATYLDKLRTVQRSLRHYIREGVSKSLDEAKCNEVICAAILVLVIVVSPVIIILVKNAVNTIQTYAFNLSEKAKELELEKDASDQLLCQMLPPSVATQLKQTQQVPAEFFASVTVYFSDIVGFTEMAAVSTPYQVISFLNSVYKMFDSRIECYDVYKIETIGDSYMVASGLPDRNGDKHASEIASMALDLLDAMSICKLPHRPEQALRMRCGIHAGPCVAGIVGTKMPRYCLFGDTVNTASRMESTGEPCRIQISEDVKILLDKTAEFKTERRGFITVKGKGEMNTYWLISKVGGSRYPSITATVISEDEKPAFLQRLHTVKKQSNHLRRPIQSQKNQTKCMLIT